ncbi:MAG: hypothetical protein JW849_04200 [Phycisphaerae bacterium]|nr:hypothetical protein [Phycisphaerae bacterium]
MVPANIPVETWRKNFRSLVLLAILGVCSAVAWVLAWHKGAPARDAREILSAIRRQGIKHYWPQNARQQRWFFIRREGNVVGWEMHHRQAGADGAIGGFVRRENAPHKQVRLSSRWRLSNDAEQGEYHSQQVVLQPPQVKVTEAAIELRDRNLQVNQNIDGAGFSSTTAIPENYLPEGLMTLAMREVAQRQGRAQFKMVLDNQKPSPPTGGQTPLFSFELRYVGQDPSTGGAKVETSFGRENPWITILDANGEMIRRYEGNTEFSPATFEEILQRFPDAAEYAPDGETTAMVYPAPITLCARA